MKMAVGARGPVGVSGATGVAGAGYGYKDGFPDYNDPKLEHRLDLVDQHQKLVKSWCWLHPWKWYKNLKEQNRLHDLLNNHEEHFPEYYL